MKKSLINYNKLYLAKYSNKNTNSRAILYIHGGPGLNCSTIEYFIQTHNYFSNLNFDLIVYDQLGCGRSSSNENISHIKNVSDLADLIVFLHQQKFSLHSIIGHSYGAKILTDYLIDYSCNLPVIFVGTSNDIVVPRINNLLIDLNQLKSIDQERYNSILKNFKCNSINDLWEQSEIIADVFNNIDRSYYYWANMEVFKLFKQGQLTTQLPLNMEVFKSVRQSLYSSSNFSLNFEKLLNKYVVINGFHDQIMNGYSGVFDNNPNCIIFDKSSHYPHLEENKKFCAIINSFLL